MILLFLAIPFIAAFLQWSPFLPLRRFFAFLGFGLPLLWLLYVALIWGDNPVRFLEKQSIGLDEWGIFLSFGINKVAWVFLFLTSIVGVSVSIISFRFIKEKVPFFRALLLIIYGSMLVCFSSRNAFLSYFSYEMTLIPSFILLLYWGKGNRRGAAMEMGMFTALSFFLILIGICGIWQIQGTLELSEFQPFLGRTTPFTLVYLLIGLGITMGLFPFYSWVPKFYALSPTALSMLHIGVIRNFAPFFFLQFLIPFFAKSLGEYQTIIFWISIISILILGLMTFAQVNLRYFIAFASIMQSGLIVFGLSSLNFSGAGGAIFLTFAYGLLFSLLFLLSEYLFQRTGSLEFEDLGGFVSRAAPTLACLFGAAFFALAGIPGLAVFWGELSIFLASWHYGATLFLLLCAGALITGLYSLKAMSRVSWGFFREKEFKDLSWKDLVAVFPLMFALVIFGIWPRLLSDSIDGGLEAMKVLIGG